jgi:hypothetical protein
MRYSCFDAQSALYDYFEDDRTIAINADVPVPRMRTVGSIGVPSIEAGERVPSGAKHVGRGWHAQGLIAQCGKGPLGAFDLSNKWVIFALAVGGAAAAMWWLGLPQKWEAARERDYWKPRRRRP